MIFGLYGINGVYNFGCEAIIRGTYRFLKDCVPDADVVYFTYNYDYDSRALSDMDIELVEIKRRKSLISRAANKLLSIFNLEKRILPFKWKEISTRADIFISIGGDMYTIPEVKRNSNSYTYYNPLADFCNRVISQGREVVIYGASLGPWGRSDKAVQYYVKNITKYKYLICREHKTIDYLNSVGVKTALFQPDPAFLVESMNSVTEEKKYIGINFSPLSMQELYGACSEDMVGVFTKIVIEIVEQFDTEVLLIPHVLSNSETDNDELLMIKILKCIPVNIQDRVSIADTGKGFLGIKEQLHKCKYVVSARMHCAINAIVESVPAIFLSYSQKSQGMVEYVYGTKKWLLSVKEMESNLIPLMQEMNSSWEELSAFLDNRLVEIKQEYNKLQSEQHLFR